MTIKITSKPFIICATATALACGIAGYAWREEHRPPLLEIYVFNLKSGSSVFVRTPDDKRILINGGANSEVIRELTKILPFYSRRIDTIISTDANGKNASGLIDILERYSVDKVVVPAVTLQSLGLASSTDQIYSTLLDTVQRLKVPLEEVSAGDRLDFGQRIGDKKVVADILFPAVPSVSTSNALAGITFQYSKASAPEIIMRISYGQTSIILLGNATTKVQKFLISSNKSSTSSVNSEIDLSTRVGLKTDVLIVPHSTLPSYFAAVPMNEMKPEYLIYSQAVTSATNKSTTAKVSSTTSSSNKKIGPLYFILDDKRFNIKETGTVKIVSDGVRILVK